MCTVHAACTRSLLPPVDHRGETKEGIVAQSFDNEVNAYVSAGKLTQAQADTLLGGPLGILAIMAAVPC